MGLGGPPDEKRDPECIVINYQKAMDNQTALSGIFALNLDPAMLELMKTLAMLAAGILLFQMTLLGAQLHYFLSRGQRARKENGV